MLHTKFCQNRSTGSGEGFLPYMDVDFFCAAKWMSPNGED